MKLIRCKNCNVEIVAKNSRKRFCSQKCRKEYELKQIDDIIKECLNCKQTFKTKNTKKQFCSVGCATSYRHKNPEFQKKHSDAMKKVHMSDEYKSKQRTSQKIAQNKIETRKKRSATLTNRWSETEFKEMMIESRKNSKILHSSGFKEKEKERNKKIANRPDVKIAKSNFNKEYHNKAEVIESKRQKMVDYWSNIENIQKRIDKDHGIYYNFELPSGRVVKLQGYESQVLEQLLQTYSEEDIICEVKSINKEIGKILYNFEGKERRYYPDFYIKSTNTIIEVKSQWTFDKWKEKNLVKEQACLQQGFNFVFIIL